MKTKYDYTSKRLGSKQPPYNRKIIICGKCGQRGTDDGTMKSNTKLAQSVTHISHIEQVAGIAFNHVDTYCLYIVGDQSQAPVDIPRGV